MRLLVAGLIAVIVGLVIAVIVIAGDDSGERLDLDDRLGNDHASRPNHGNDRADDDRIDRRPTTNRRPTTTTEPTTTPTEPTTTPTPPEEEGGSGGHRSALAAPATRP